MTGSSSKKKSELYPLIEDFVSDLFISIKRFQIEPLAFFIPHKASH